LASGDTHTITELIERQASLGAKMPDALTQGHKITHVVTISKK
jgi:hypothetical protein